MDSVIDLIKERCSIVEVVGRWVRLSRRGRDHWGLCPFHKEKTPSFCVSSQRYRCYGCQSHGDVVDFVQKIERCDFQTALNTCARIAGVTIPKRASENKTDHEALLSLMTQVQQAFANNVSHQVRAYLGQRDVSDKSITHFGLGWCPETSTFMRWAREKGWNQEHLLRIGLIADHDKEVYARFHRRITIPIFQGNKLVAFGGRALDGRAARYINSPETELFKKRMTLFCDEALDKAVQEKERLIVVEGYFDVIALAQGGFRETCAPLGTAVSEDQLQRMWRKHPSVTICFDGDEAGIRAMKRVCAMALPMVNSERYLQWVFLPPGMDPDTYLRTHGHAAFSRLLAGAQPMSVMLKRIAHPPQHHASREEQAAYLTRWRRLLDQITDKTYRYALMADWREEQSTLFFQRANRPQAKNRPASRVQQKLPKESSYPKQKPGLLSQRLLLACLLRNPDLLAEHSEVLLCLDLQDQAFLNAMIASLPSSMDRGQFTTEDLKQILGEQHSQMIETLENDALSSLLAEHEEKPEDLLYSFLALSNLSHDQEEFRLLARRLAKEESLKEAEGYSKKVKWLDRHVSETM